MDVTFHFLQALVAWAESFLCSSVWHAVSGLRRRHRSRAYGLSLPEAMPTYPARLLRLPRSSSRWDHATHPCVADVAATLAVLPSSPGVCACWADVALWLDAARMESAPGQLLALLVEHDWGAGASEDMRRGKAGVAVFVTATLRVLARHSNDRWLPASCW